ncbi:MAG: shikimate dehydrogenase [Syntrophomonadaceae bacterium]|nr:shikimate dehydrogenase [Syntrophomonadaceae bacterium]
MLINSRTALLGILGNPLGHSLSPLMHNLTLQKMDLNYIYVPLEVGPDRLEEAITGIRALNFRGVNVTIPYKKAVIPFLDDLSPEASACAAVNLIRNENGRLTGFNTDGPGFMASLAQEGVDSTGNVLLLGAGGAAQSLAYELSIIGARQLNILDLDGDKASELAGLVNKLAPGQAFGAQMSEGLFAGLSREADLIINCTPVGMYPHLDESPVPSLREVRPDTVVYDIIYNPLTTKFLAAAQASNLKTINGLSMFVNQGALTLRILTGFDPPVDYMKEVVLDTF